MAIYGRNGLSTRSYEDWAHLWEDNPLRREWTDSARGWILEDSDGRPVGAFTNIPLAFEWNGRRLRGAVAGPWAVDLAHRKAATSLLVRFFRQTGADLLVNTTTNREAGQAFGFLKAEKMPRPDYNDTLFWITGYRGFADAALRKKNLPAGAVRYPAAAVLVALDLFRGPRFRRSSARVRLLDSFTPEFDGLWQQLRASGGLRAVRDYETLRWHFRVMFRHGRGALFAAEEGGRLAGYLVLQLHSSERLRLRRHLIVDMQVLDGRPDIVHALVKAAIDYSRSRGGHSVEALGFGAAKRAALMELRPRLYTQPVWPYYWKAADRAVAEGLRNRDVWDPCPYDGDGTM